jgi:hypothetical protein
MAKVADSHPQAVLAVCQRLAAGEINPSQALVALKAATATATAAAAPAPAKAAPAPTLFKRGKRPYAQVVRAGGVITVKLTDQGLDDAEALHSAIQALIQAHASRK